MADGWWIYVTIGLQRLALIFDSLFLLWVILYTMGSLSSHRRDSACWSYLRHVCPPQKQYYACSKRDTTLHVLQQQNSHVKFVGGAEPQEYSKSISKYAVATQQNSIASYYIYEQLGASVPGSLTRGTILTGRNHNRYSEYRAIYVCVDDQHHTLDEWLVTETY